MRKNNAFTLAKTLITLTVLGLVAALSIPSLVRKFQDRIAVTQVKKAYSLFSNALEQMIVIEGPMATWNWPYPEMVSKTENADFFADKLRKYLNISKYCGAAECFPEIDWNHYYTLDNKTAPNHSYRADYLKRGKMVLKNGWYVTIHPGAFDTSVSVADGEDSTHKKYGVGSIRVDINGKKGPNRYGYDLFFFKYGKKGIGLDYIGISKEYCNYTTGYGSSCSYWILKHNNMDYKYRDVSDEW